jgi:hypothetical protein
MGGRAMARDGAICDASCLAVRGDQGSDQRVFVVQWSTK